mgnify:CR=1 FL=1
MRIFCGDWLLTEIRKKFKSKTTILISGKTGAEAEIKDWPLEIV